MTITFDMSIFIARSGSALQKACNITDTVTRSTINWKTAHISPTPASLLFWTHFISLQEVRQQQDSSPSSRAGGCSLHSTAKLPFSDYLSLLTCHRVSIYLKQLLSSMKSPCSTSDWSFKFSTRKHIVPHDYDSRDCRWKDRNTLPPFNNRSSHHSLAAVLMHLKCIKTTFNYQKFKLSN